MKLIRQSGLPTALEHYERYQQEWTTGYDNILANAGTDMPSVQSMCSELEAKLGEKYPRTLDVPIPRTEKAWKKLVEAYGAPIMLAQSMEDGNPLVMVLMDEIRS